MGLAARLEQMIQECKECQQIQIIKLGISLENPFYTDLVQVLFTEQAANTATKTERFDMHVLREGAGLDSRANCQLLSNNLP